LGASLFLNHSFTSFLEKLFFSVLKFKIYIPESKWETSTITIFSLEEEKDFLYTFFPARSQMDNCLMSWVVWLNKNTLPLVGFG